MAFLSGRFGIFAVLCVLSLAAVSGCGCGDDDNDDSASDDDDSSDDDATDDDATDDDATDDDADDDTGDDDADDDADDDTGDDDTTTEGFAFIPAGTFTMGSPPDELGHASEETQHEVTLTNDFEIGIHETTQADFEDLMGWNPSFFGPNGPEEDCGDDCPVEFVSWFDAVAYANQLSISHGLAPCYVFSQVNCEDATNVAADYMACMNNTQKGIDNANWGLDGVSSVYDCEGFRLPTESEWEYAVRAGTTTAFYSGPMTQLDCSPIDSNLNQIGWYCGNSNAGPEEVGQKQPNTWDLYDMSGNVWEWTWDWYALYAGDVTDPEGALTGLYRTIRGGSGSLTGKPRLSRSAYRMSASPNDRESDAGFRLVRTLP